MIRVCHALFILSCCWLLGACASVSVRTAKQVDLRGAQILPARIYVQNFSIPQEALRVDRNDRKLMEFQAQYSEYLANALTKTLDRNLVPTKRLSKEVPRVPSNSWLVIGRFDKVNQGSRLLRSTLGFGLGGTKVDATAVVYDLSQPKPVPLLIIQTTGGSNSAPGAVTGLIQPFPLGPIAIGMLASNVGVGALPGLNADAKRTAREIAAAISDYSAQQGLIPKNKAMRPKRMGELQVRFMDPARVKSVEEKASSKVPSSGTGTISVTPADPTAR